MRIPLVPKAWLLAALITSGCATTLDPGAADVKILRDSSAVNECVTVGHIDPHPDTPGYTEAEARNLTVELGGNTFLVTSQSLGSMISGVAYRCQ